MAIYENILKRDSVGGRYKVRRLLGAGTFGEVFLADQEVAGAPGVKFREVALKLFTQDYVSRSNAAEVFAEAIMLERLAARARAAGEPVHLVTIYDLGVLRDYEGAPYVAMECVNGSLEKELENSSLRLPLDTVLRHMRGICAGLRLAHENGPAVIHRDLKPANILIESNGFLKVADFGLAIERHDAFLKTGAAGTIAYAPPENRHEGIATPAFDVYSLGVMMIEMLTRNNPLADALAVAGTSPKEVDAVLDLAQHRLANLEDFEGNPISDRLHELRDADSAMAILRKCLHIQPSGRYANVMDLDRALADLQSGRSVAPSTQQRTETGRERVSRMLEQADTILRGPAGPDRAKVGDLLREVFVLSPCEQHYFELMSVWCQREGRQDEAIVAQKAANRIAAEKSSTGRTPPDLLERLMVLYQGAGKLAAAGALRKELGR